MLTGISIADMGPLDVAVMLRKSRFELYFSPLFNLRSLVNLAFSFAWQKMIPEA